MKPAALSAPYPGPFALGTFSAPDKPLPRRRDLPNAWFADAYGLTETVSGDTFLDREHALTKLGSVGRPVPHTRVRIVDEDGFLYIDDRKKDMIVSGGENIATPEVERVLYEHPAILEAAVVGLQHPRWGEVPRAFVVFRPDENAGADELREFCRTRLAKFKVPVRFDIVDELPRTPSGKVLKRTLRAIPAEG